MDLLEVSSDKRQMRFEYFSHGFFWVKSASPKYYLYAQEESDTNGIGELHRTLIFSPLSTATPLLRQYLLLTSS